MDELEFRRKLYANPYCDDKDVLAAKQNDPKKHSFCLELQQLEQKMQAASQVKVPKDLAHKLILRQSLHSHKQQKTRSRIQLALVASVAFVVGISFTLWQQSTLLDISKQAIAHVIHEGNYALGAQENISLEQVNAKLATFGGSFNEDIGRIYYANFCDFQNLRSLHMVVQGVQGKVSVFIIPHQSGHLKEGQALDKKYQSQAIDLQRASIVVVGETAENVATTKQKLSEKIIFSA
ncbi:DUF3379 domain-containing protein [Paraglaciecola aestuariivivens]